MTETRTVRAAHEISAREEAVIVASAKKMRREDGLGWHTIAKHFNVNYSWLRRRCDPAFRARRNAQADRYGSRYYREPVDPHFFPVKIPIDTRDLTGRLCGDPTYQRSALYEKRAGQ